MKVTYLGMKPDMRAHGYDFSNGKTANVPETDTNAVKKFLGNRFFHCDHPDNYSAPQYYVYNIENIRLPNDSGGNARFKRQRGSQKQKGFDTMQQAEAWVAMNGTLNETHYIKKSDEGIRPGPVPTPAATLGDLSVVEGVQEHSLSLAIFRKKENGKPYSKPDKTFKGTSEADLKETAFAWMKDEGIDPDERILAVR